MRLEKRVVFDGLDQKFYKLSGKIRGLTILLLET